MRERVQDVLLAVFVTVMQVQGTMARVADEPSVIRPLDAGGYGLLILGGVVLIARRRQPVLVFVVTAAASLAYYGLDYPDGPGWLGLFVALYTLTALGDGRRSLVVAGVGITVLATGWLIAAVGIEPRAAIGWVFFRIGASVMSAALGESVRSRRVIAVEALARAELAERTREQEARARVGEERLRIAREVHDTVAHAIAIINVQSGVTAHVLDRRPEQAREALRVIEETSSRALREMRVVLRVLHDDSPDGPGTRNSQPHAGPRTSNDPKPDALGTRENPQLDDFGARENPRPDALSAREDPQPDALSAREDPQPNVIGAREDTHPHFADADHDVPCRDLGTLLAGARRAGLDVVCEPAELAVAVPGPVGDAVYRIVQESLSNVLRHAGPTRVTVAVGRDGGQLRVRVTDEGPGGRGIPGMRERCRLLGGELSAGPLTGGGFEVSARLPVERS